MHSTAVQSCVPPLLPFPIQESPLYIYKKKGSFVKAWMKKIPFSNLHIFLQRGRGLPTRSFSSRLPKGPKWPTGMTIKLIKIKHVFYIYWGMLTASYFKEKGELSSFAARPCLFFFLPSVARPLLPFLPFLSFTTIFQLQLWNWKHKACRT